jgi:hypothetical protein
MRSFNNLARDRTQNPVSAFADRALARRQATWAGLVKMTARRLVTLPAGEERLPTGSKIDRVSYHSKNEH